MNHYINCLQNQIFSLLQGSKAAHILSSSFSLTGSEHKQEIPSLCISLSPYICACMFMYMYIYMYIDIDIYQSHAHRKARLQTPSWPFPAALPSPSSSPPDLTPTRSSAPDSPRSLLSRPSSRGPWLALLFGVSFSCLSFVYFYCYLDGFSDFFLL